jgi:hypothetical protein
MALKFDNTTSDHVDHGSDASLDDLTAGSIMIWLWPNDVSNDFEGVCSKTESDGYNDGWSWYKMGADGTRLRFTYARAVSDQDVRMTTSSLSAQTWHCCVVTFNTAGSPASYVGDLTTKLSDVSDTVTAGSGSKVTDAAHPLRVGSTWDTTNYDPFGGRIALCSIWNTQLTLAQLQIQQYEIRRPIVAPGNCVFFCNYFGTGTQVDWSGNGSNGTVTNATAAPHVPLRWFGMMGAPYVVAAAAAPVPSIVYNYRRRRV